ncbi:hypothetical protein GGR23_002051 [Gellertiella hungarica]|uniref:Uncharacterized protein n=2 Tax=Gellertiella hungarica TaxID=1572859 RepID=A0A7W6J4X2_9HYPH|nr:hypothetical protein [Gellertiella hungarica]MBB4064864.1 hypothetical protein [Gellertiella hungarica]
MSGLSRAVRGFLILMGTLSWVTTATAQDAPQADMGAASAPSVSGSEGGGLADDPLKAFQQLDGVAKMPKLNAFTAPNDPLSPAAMMKTVRFEAKLKSDGKPVEDGLVWSVFSPNAGSDEKLPLVATATGGSSAFQLAPGDYFVNVAFGRAGVTKRLKVPLVGDVPRQTLVLDAGGLLLNAVSGSDMRIPADDLSFTIYSTDIKEDGERGLVMDDVNPNEVVRLNAGTYHVVSNYGDINAVIRADIQVEAGRLTKAVLQHRAAQITLKLVSEKGGEALADTAWSVLTSSGDTLAESVSAFPTLILSEGQYTAVARNKDKIYQMDFKVTAGVNTDVEVITSQSLHRPDTQAAVFAD